MGADGWVYLFGDAARAGGGHLTLVLDDLDAELARLADRGVVPGPAVPEGGMRKVVIGDPDGNLIQLAGQ